MDIVEKIPDGLVEGVSDPDERAVRIGRFLILEEMGFFGEKSNVTLAQGDYDGTFVAAVRRRFSNTYGDVAGCHPADIEVAAEMLGVFDVVFNAEVKNGTQPK